MLVYNHINKWEEEEAEGDIHAMANKNTAYAANCHNRMQGRKKDVGRRRR